MRHTAALAIMLALFAFGARGQQKTAQPERERFEDPALLSFEDLVALSSSAKPEGELAVRLNSLLTRPFVNNDASAAGTTPHRPNVEGLGPVVRVGLWNIERGLNFELIRSALTDTQDFERLQGSSRQISDAAITVLNTLSPTIPAECATCTTTNESSPICVSPAATIIAVPSG